jgi:hypothetical protein
LEVNYPPRLTHSRLGSILKQTEKSPFFRPNSRFYRARHIGMVIAQATHAELYPVGIKLKAVLTPATASPQRLSAGTVLKLSFEKGSV